MAEEDPTKKVEEVKEAEKPRFDLTHPDLLPQQGPDPEGATMRRTIVRTAKMIGPKPNEDGTPSLVEVPIEPSHNNHGNPDDPQQPIRHYMNKGFQQPHVYDPETYDFLYCAVSGCWEHAEWPLTERCSRHERAFQAGWIRYASNSKPPVVQL